MTHANTTTINSWYADQLLAMIQARLVMGYELVRTWKAKERYGWVYYWRYYAEMRKKTGPTPAKPTILFHIGPVSER